MANISDANAHYVAKGCWRELKEFMRYNQSGAYGLATNGWAEDDEGVIEGDGGGIAFGAGRWAYASTVESVFTELNGVELPASLFGMVERERNAENSFIERHSDGETERLRWYHEGASSVWAKISNELDRYRAWCALRDKLQTTDASLVISYNDFEPGCELLGHGMIEITAEGNRIEVKQTEWHDVECNAENLVKYGYYECAEDALEALGQE